MADRSAPVVPSGEIASPYHRRLSIGAEPMDRGRTHFRVWAPRARRVDVADGDGRLTPLEPEAGGYFSGAAEARIGDRYGFKLDDDQRLHPDPASRFQPEGPHGPSEIVDPHTFRWTDQAWTGATLAGQVAYEMHVGTFTRTGTFAAADDELRELARIGITLIELMPVAEFEGRFGWGYDGVDLFAPTRLYGAPDDFRRFVDAAHACGVAVILDVVYNHLWPVVSYLRAFSTAYFTYRYENEWGDAINFDGPDAGPVREFFLANAEYWIAEFHLDGLRLDATQQIFDRSASNIMAEIGLRAREAAGDRSIVMIAENEPQDTRLVRPLDEGGYGLDAVWNDDCHHSASPARWRAMTALLLLLPATPMLFQGQEFAASAPFLYFADFDRDLADAVQRGRAEFLRQFPSIADLEERGGVLANPGDPATFERCRLDFAERQTHAAAYALHVDLLRLRREELACRSQQPGGVDGAVLSPSAFALRFFTPDHRDDRLLVVNLGADLTRGSFAEPLLAPPAGTDWALRWSSEDPAYAGNGTPATWPDGCWSMPAESALVLSPGPKRPRHPLPLVRRRTA